MRRELNCIRNYFLSLEQLWRTHPLATMASVKLSFLVSPALIVSVGLERMPLPTFIRCSLTVSTIYLGALAALGYGFAKIYGSFHLSMTSAAIYLAIPGLAMLAGLGYGTVLMRRRLRPKLAAQKSKFIQSPDRT